MIEKYDFGCIQIGGRTYTSDVVVYPDRVDASWWRREGHLLSLDDVQDALAEEPEAIVVGTGAHGAMRVAEDVRRKLRESGVELHVAKTPEACRLFNALAAKKRTIALLHLTC